MIRSLFTPIVGGAGGVGGIHPINPLTLPWEVLLDSRNIAAIPAGNPIPLWPDASGNGRDANPVPGFNPLYRPTSSPANKPMADFGAVPNSQMFGTLPIAGITQARGFSFYAYYILDSVPAAVPGDSQIIFGDDTAGGFRLFPSAFQALNDMQPIFTSSAGTILGSQLATAGSPHVLACICPPPAGSPGVLFLDGIPIGTGNWNTNLNTGYLVSGNSVQNVWLRGRAAFVGVGSRTDSIFTVLGVTLGLRQAFG